MGNGKFGGDMRAVSGLGQLLTGPAALEGELPDGSIDNSPGNPDRVSPVGISVASGQVLTVPPLSFIVLKINGGLKGA